jgi:hypothetical protein
LDSGSGKEEGSSLWVRQKKKRGKRAEGEGRKEREEYRGESDREKEGEV